jgi:hypothetical protein
MSSIDQANKIIEKIATENKYITPITLQDIELFEKFFIGGKHTYGNSWSYVTQGVYGIGPNKLGYKYYDGENLSVICVYPKIENNSEFVFYWIRPMGKTIFEKIVNIADELLIKYKIKTYVKKIFIDEYNFLISNGFHDIKDCPWHRSVISEDDTYPEQIIDVKNTVELAHTLPTRKHLRKSLIRVNQLKEKFEIKKDNNNFNNIAWDLTKEFFHSELILKKELNLSTEYDYFNMIFQNPDRSGLYKQIIYVNNNPIGYYILERNNEDYVSLYALIVLRHKLKFIVDYILLDMFETSPTKYINMGGSEDEGIHKFKLKYMPLKEQKMHWAVYL